MKKFGSPVPAEALSVTDARESVTAPPIVTPFLAGEAPHHPGSHPGPESSLIYASPAFLREAELSGRTYYQRSAKWRSRPWRPGVRAGRVIEAIRAAIPGTTLWADAKMPGFYRVRVLRIPGGTVVYLYDDPIDGEINLVAIHSLSREGYRAVQKAVWPLTRRAPKVPPPDPIVPTTMYLLSRCGMRYELRDFGEESVRSTPFIPGNYNVETVDAYRYLADELRKPEPAGRLALLEGPPGTGKTRMIRSLIGELEGKMIVVIVPPHLVTDLSGPELIPALLGQPLPILLVLEDADFALVSREPGSTAKRAGSISALSSLLNLSDGIVGTHVDLRLLATTNAKVKDIDPAALRPGRLLTRIAVGPLAPDRARALIERETGAPFSSRLGSITLAEAYDRARERKRGKTVPRSETVPAETPPGPPPRIIHDPPDEPEEFAEDSIIDAPAPRGAARLSEASPRRRGNVRSTRKRSK